MKIATAFLSHSCKDKPLVEAVAEALGQRGIIPWLDKQQLLPGESLIEQLKTAIGKQVVVALFLSQDALSSAWVQDELRVALQLEDENHYRDWIIPIYLGNPLNLIKSSRLLYDRWLRADGEGVDRVGIQVRYPVSESVNIPAQEIAHKLAKKVYDRLKFQEASEVNIVLDQRGNGPRVGSYKLPQIIDREKDPTLVFRPDSQDKSYTETLVGKEWERFRDNIKVSLSHALGDLRSPRTVRILGNAQLGLAYFLGRCFDRTTAVTLYCYHFHPDFRTIFDNTGQERHKLLSGGNPFCETTIEQNPQDTLLPEKLKNQEKYPSVALYIGKRDYLHDVKTHLEATESSLPLVFIQTEFFHESDEVMKLVKDVVALLKRLKEHNSTTIVRLYCDLPFNVMPLLSANLTHTIHNIEFLEYRRDLQGKPNHPDETYMKVLMNE